jgi:enediyne biosynthesis protein E4
MTTMASSTCSCPTARPSSTNVHSFLYRNNGDGTFSTITNSTLVTDLGSFYGGAWGDYDNDGKLDLFLIANNDFGAGQPNRLYHNNGDGTFTRVTTGSIATDVANSDTCDWGDYDNDGFLDLFVANEFGQKSFLYHNNGDGTFTRITNGIVVNDISHSPSGVYYGAYGCAWGDYDNDGWLDLYVGNAGAPDLAAPPAVNFLYHNNGDGTFTKVTTGSPVNEYSDSFGVTWADYDNDGFLDLFASRTEGRGNYLYRNNGNSNSWLTVKLIGTVSNRSAIGAKVRAKAIIGGVSRWQLRQITGGGGGDGHNELRANFGLGDATNVELVRIEWPSGIVQTLTNVAPKQILNVVEHQQPGAVTAPSFTSVSRATNGAVNLSVAGDAGLLYLLEASTNLVNWSRLGVRTNATGAIQFLDFRATNNAKRFYRVSIP